MNPQPKPRSRFTPAEDEIIRQFGSEGFDGLLARLPWRSKDGIRNRAMVIGAKVRHANEARGMTLVPSNTPPLIKKLYEELKTRSLSRTSVAKRAGIHRQSIREWLYRSPRLDLFVAVLNSVDLDLEIVPRREGT